MSTPAWDPHQMFPAFYSNPAIKHLAPSPRWTVSAELDVRAANEEGTVRRRKVPLDIRELARGGSLRGARERTAHCLMTLDELMAFLPNAANCAYALNVHLDRLLVLDIEPDCPPHIAAELLALPHLYSELSMSGRGYHMVMPLPANFDQYPVAAGKIVLREEHGWYEVLLDHWITFTRVPVPPERIPQRASMTTWEAVYAHLAGKATQDAVNRAAVADVTATKPEIPGEHEALHVMTKDPLPKTVEDFHGDHSRFEFSTLSTLYHRLTPLLPYLTSTYNVEYTPAMRAWLLYEAARKVLPHRPKHDELRRGMPLLLNAATDLLARREAQRSGGVARSGDA